MSFTTPPNARKPFPPATPPPWTPPQRPHERALNQLIQTDARPPRWYTDMYAFLLRIGWGRLLLMYILLYLAINVLFGTLYVLAGPCIKGARPYVWSDAFFFSVQTLSTIGYGGMTPEGLAGNLLVTVESMLGVIGLALATGLVFAKFARATSRVMFSRAAVISPYNGKPCLMFRLANQRGTNIVEASLKATILLDEHTAEGHHMRRLHDLKVRRNFTPVFVLSWLVIHEIDEESPLYGLTEADREAQDIRVIITMTGIDGVFNQTIHSYHLYWYDEIYEGLDFVDVIERKEHGVIKFRVERFHDLQPARTSALDDKEPNNDNKDSTNDNCDRDDNDDIQSPC